MLPINYELPFKAKPFWVEPKDRRFEVAMREISTRILFVRYSNISARKILLSFFNL